MGINSPDQLRHHPLRGSIFESWVAAEIVKLRVHTGNTPAVHHFRESRGLEVDLVIDAGVRLVLVEAKSGATVRSQHLGPLARLSQLLQTRGETREIQSVLVHGGEEFQRRSIGLALPWSAIERGPWLG